MFHKNSSKIKTVAIANGNLQRGETGMKFFQAFFESAKNADGIRFDISNFNSKRNPITNREMMIIKKNKDLMDKAVWIRDGVEQVWTGKKFVPK
ncbi:hypothetical protein [Tenacibaculum maritimum]|uniref:hypothetical protein n=1 Tax=Tenacibaculum maritimum TaxID=107401 RepID=UPI0012E55AE1|nr:hypothetical protein [Tenacibaculum maritimum]CAA0197351.1 hypothetical protein JIP1097_230004 [Tenacibaculum maritimum]